jgi:hypothetical protein
MTISGLDFEYSLLEQARELAVSAQRIYVLLIPEGADLPVDRWQDHPRVITTRRAHPRIPVHAAAAAAVRRHLGYDAIRPLFIGVIPDGTQYAAVYCARVPADA